MKRSFLYGAVMITVGTFLIAATGWAQAQPKADVRGDAVNGRTLYLADGCWQCHGRVGQGGLMTGPAPVLAQTKLPFAAFSRQLRNPINDMPPYPVNLLSDKEVADLYAFLQALPGRRPVKDVPLLNN
jgi:mono/diheme cytochrome c family protein